MPSVVDSLSSSSAVAGRLALTTSKEPHLGRSGSRGADQHRLGQFACRSGNHPGALGRADAVPGTIFVANNPSNFGAAGADSWSSSRSAGLSERTEQGEGLSPCTARARAATQARKP